MDVEAGITARARRAIQTDSARPAPVRPQACPVEDWLAFLGHRWNALILWHLRAGPLRHRELVAVLPQVTPKVLGDRLAALGARGLVTREGGAAGAPRRYAITPGGLGLLAVLDQLEQWSLTETARYAPPA